ncbi:hypothetical protein CHUAL_003604 [Chamberlinius hualienensis]
MAVHLILPLLLNALTLKGVYSHLNNIALTQVPTLMHEGDRNVYECHFPNRVQYCLWYFNGEMAAPSQRKFKYEEETNGENTNNCTISIPAFYLIFKKYQLSCVGIQNLSPSVVNTGDPVLLPCYSKIPVYCEWVNSRNERIPNSEFFKDLSDRITNCSLVIPRVELWNFGLWTCKNEVTNDVLALYYLSPNITATATTATTTTATTTITTTTTIHEIVDNPLEQLNETNYSHQTSENGFPLILIILCTTQATTIIFIIILSIIHIKKTTQLLSLPAMSIVNSQLKYNHF